MGGTHHPLHLVGAGVEPKSSGSLKHLGFKTCRLHAVTSSGSAVGRRFLPCRIVCGVVVLEALQPAVLPDDFVSKNKQTLQLKEWVAFGVTCGHFKNKLSLWKPGEGEAMCSLPGPCRLLEMCPVFLVAVKIPLCAARA